MKIKSKSVPKFIIIYYVFLLMGCLVISRPEASLSLMYRLMMMFFAFLPMVFNIKYILFSFVTFLGIDSISFFSIFPTQIIYYYGIIIVALIIYRKYIHIDIKLIGLWCVFVLFSFLHLEWQSYLEWLLLSILLSFFIQTKDDLKYLIMALIVLSIFLALLFIINYKYYLVQFGALDAGFERSGWINQNIFGAIIGCGFVLLLGILFGHISFQISDFERIAFIIFSLFIYIVLVLNASRGALLSTTIVGLLLFLTSKLKRIFKLIVLFIMVGVYYLFYISGVFDLFLYRMEEGVESGGGRTIIWAEKLFSFLNINDFNTYLIGIGIEGAFALGTMFGNGVSTHNDIVTVLISYGVVGLLFYFVMILYPLKQSINKDKLLISILLLFFILESCVVEPFFRGYIVFYMFYIFIYKYAILKFKNH